MVSSAPGARYARRVRLRGVSPVKRRVKMSLTGRVVSLQRQVFDAGEGRDPCGLPQAGRSLEGLGSVCQLRSPIQVFGRVAEGEARGVRGPGREISRNHIVTRAPRSPTLSPLCDALRVVQNRTRTGICGFRAALPEKQCFLGVAWRLLISRLFLTRSQTNPKGDCQ